MTHAQWCMDDCYKVLKFERTFIEHDHGNKKVFIASHNLLGKFSVHLPATAHNVLFNGW